MQLDVYLEGELKETVPLTEERLTIGRSGDNRLRLHGPQVLALHAEITIGPDGPQLTDLGSERGTLVNGELIMAHAPHRLNDGAVIKIGLYVLVYQADPATLIGKPPPAVAAADTAMAAEPATQLFTLAPSSPRTVDIPPAAGPVSRYLEELPGLYHSSDFLGRYLLIPETIWEPLEQRQNFIAAYFDPRTCPESFIAWIGAWMDLSIDPYWPEARRRHLLAAAFEITRWRGTRYGLELLIEACTGLEPIITTDPAEPLVFCVAIKLPRERAAERALIENLICTHKPVHVGYRLEIELIDPPATVAK
jgi:phage tail-like protein